MRDIITEVDIFDPLREWVACDGPYFEVPRCQGYGYAADFVHYQPWGREFICPACWAAYAADAQDFVDSARYS